MGYAIVVGFGAFFSIFTSVMVFMDYRFGGTRTTSEQFNCAGRTIKTGLIAVDIVSHWCAHWSPQQQSLAKALSQALWH